MKLICTSSRTPIVFCMLLICMQGTMAQICSNPAGVIYGMDNSGAIYPINTANGVVGARINPAYPGNAPAASNAIGYNPTNGRFYFFKRNADQTPQEFVSFNPATNSYAILANCPTTNNIRTGCVNANGTGYYCLDATANLYFYRFSSNTWRFITNTYFNQFGTNVSAAMAVHSSGDVAMDGWGDFWFLCSDATSYGLYYFRGSLPVNPVASISVIEKIPPTTPTPTGNNFAGIGFSPTGQIYLTQSGSNRLYRLNNDLTLTLMGTFTVPNVGGDATSCVMPFAALAIKQIDFKVQRMTDQQITLVWNSQDINVKGYFVEYSNDAEKWITLGFVEDKANAPGNLKYTFIHTAPNNGRFFYRIRQVGMDEQFIYSDVKFIDVHLESLVSIGPNPTNGIIQIVNHKNEFTTGCIMDVSGHMIKQVKINKGINTLSIAELTAGTYLLRLQSEYGQLFHQKIVKE